MDRKRLYVIIFAAILIVLLVSYFIVFTLPFLFVPGDKLLDEARCKDEDAAVNEELAGMLVSKSKSNKSHMWETIEYVRAGSKSISLILRNDRSGAYDYLLVGDSVSKHGGSLDFVVIRDGQSRAFKLDFGCQRSKKRVP